MGSTIFTSSGWSIVFCAGWYLGVPLWGTGCRHLRGARYFPRSGAWYQLCKLQEFETVTGPLANVLLGVIGCGFKRHAVKYSSIIPTHRRKSPRGSRKRCFHNCLFSLEAFGIQLYDSHIAKIRLLAERVFSNYDTKYDLKSGDRFAASVYHKASQYSPSIRHSLSRFLAIAGNFPERFPSCMLWKLKQLIDDVVRKVIVSSDWRIIATMENNFQFLAEASPLCFAKSVQEAITVEDSGLCAYLSESEDLFGKRFYGSLLVYALTRIACKQEFFSPACFSAFCVLKARPEHLEALTSVFLPWAPKTEAPFPQRISIIKQFFEENDDLAWKFLCTLLPGQTMACGAFAKPKYLTCKIEEQHSVSDTYWEESDAYLELAIEKGAGHKERLLTLLEFLDKASEDIFCKILSAIETVCLNSIDNERYVFWNKLLNLFCKHKQFPNADWTMPEEALDAIALLTEKVAPKDR